MRKGGDTKEREDRRRTSVVVMEEDIRKQGMLYLQQQRFGKVPGAAQR